MVMEGVKGHFAMWTRDAIRLIGKRCSSFYPCAGWLVHIVLPPSSGNSHYCREYSTWNPSWDTTWGTSPQQRPVCMHVRRRCLCLLILVHCVKPEVESVFKEKIARGDGLKGGRMKTGRCARLLFFFSFQKQACLSSRELSTGGAVWLSAGCWWS